MKPDYPVGHGRCLRVLRILEDLLEGDTELLLSEHLQARGARSGQLEILDLRHRTEQHLGDGFDIKSFHDVMLTNGAMTLPMLRRRVEEDLLS